MVGGRMLQIARNLVGRRPFTWPKQRPAPKSGPSASRQEARNGGAVDERTVHYSHSTYLPVWESICEHIPFGSRVLEVGCGPAQFAHLLMDRKIPGGYVGFDVSAAAVELARQKLPGSRVEVGDALTTDLFTSVDYDIVVITDVLGSVDDDLRLLERIPRETQVLATVPAKAPAKVPANGSANPVRSFESAGEVLSRYRCLFSSLEISQHHHAADTNGPGATSFLLDGVR